MCSVYFGFTSVKTVDSFEGRTGEMEHLHQLYRELNMRNHIGNHHDTTPYSHSYNTHYIILFTCELTSLCLKPSPYMLIYALPKTNIPSSTCKCVVGILVSLWDGLFSGAMLVSGSLYISQFPLPKSNSKRWHLLVGHRSLCHRKHLWKDWMSRHRHLRHLR